ncbi:PLP-dependent transferase [Periconia macrospinosa]|uniref:PLP-dependent transferase n=1 Tax=Periconia macrospinosa TaxID=97972 RepID=A0A2V1CZP4_9PLEO|nr:PLP-dependent transferase [Periconia macrospinosa]
MPSITPFSNLFLSSGVEDNNEAREFFKKVIDLGISFKTSPNVFSERVKAVPSKVTFDRMPKAGLSFEGLMQEFEDITLSSSNWSSPNFLGFPDAANSVAGLAAAMLIPMLNQNMANQEICSPEATFKEMEVIHWLREALGYSVPISYMAASGVGGVETLGGCLSNTIALLAAREKLFPGSSLKGIPVLPNKIRVLVPNVIEHYSIRSAMAWLSLGEQNVIRVPVNDKFHMDQIALERIIEEERDNGNHILACILLEHKIWFHVDACHGTQLVFSNKHKHKLQGIEGADSVTIDPHKTLFLPYNCSFVLFRDPATHAATSTNSDLILNTRWSLGQITPFIGSKAFDALKLWSLIKCLGKDCLGRLIDDRLELTGAIQSEIRQRSHLVLMNETDINSCMMVFMPQELQDFCLQQNTRLSDSDMEKLNKINYKVRDEIRKDGNYYVHGFPLKSCSHERFIAPGKQLYVLRTMNGNPTSAIENARGLLDEIERLGLQFLKDAQYQIMGPDSPASRLRKIETKLDHSIRAFLGGRDYATVIYGSSALGENALLSDIDLMIFVRDAEPSLHRGVEAIFRSIMQEEGILIDAEVPFERKLLVPIQLASKAVKSGPPLDESGRVLGIRKTPDYLGSEEMLKRLVFNVLTTPNKILSVSGGIVDDVKRLEHEAANKLVDLIRTINPGKLNTAEDFVKLASSDGARSGEEYLGYKGRANVVAKLTQMFHNVSKTKIQPKTGIY